MRGPGFGRKAPSITLGFQGGGMFANDNGVVDNNAEHHDEGKHRHHVNALTGQPHDAESRKQRDRNTHCDPEGDARIEKYKQHQQYDHQTLQTILNQNEQTPFD